MSDDLLSMTTASLAGRAVELSFKLHSIEGNFRHEPTANDILSIADELSLLSTTLWRLHEAILADPQQYTDSFNEDLSEITRELKLVFEEISECGDALRKADTSTGTVAWLFKKGRVHRLQKHLETLKTTLVVMRTVLWHGKEYGTHKAAGNFNDLSPHTMHEDRVILESVVAKNRNAILDLHNLDEARVHQQGHSSSRDEVQAARNSHRTTTSTGSDVPSIPEILSAALQSQVPANPSSPSRRLSKRGVRLGVHTALLDMGARDVPKALKDKWVRQPGNTVNKQPEVGNTAGGLPRISEVESMTSPRCKSVKEFADLGDRPIEEQRSSREDLNTAVSEQFPGNDGTEQQQSCQRKVVSKDKKSLFLAPVGKGLKRMMKLLTFSTAPVDKGKRREDLLEVDETERARKEILKEDRSALRTPDYDEEFENGCGV